MLNEFVARLAIALPLTCLAAVLVLLAVRRGWLSLPSFGSRPARSDWKSLVRTRRNAAEGDTPLHVLSVRALTPAARVAVVNFRGRELLLGVNGQSLVVLASADDSASCPSRAERQP